MSKFFFVEPEHEAIRESVNVSVYCLFQGHGLNSIQFSQVAIEHDPVITDEVNLACYAFNREHGFLNGKLKIENLKCAYGVLLLTNERRCKQQPQIMPRKMTGEGRGEENGKLKIEKGKGKRE